jgi:hypothetical protein
MATDRPMAESLRQCIAATHARSVGTFVIDNR